MIEETMEILRYCLTLILIYIMPIVIMFWLVIHAFSEFWRSTRPVNAYISAGIVLSIVCLICFSYQAEIMGKDLGTNALLFTLGAAIYIFSWVLWKPVKHHLDFKTFAGVPEVTNEKIDLIVDGPFKMVRHPRYLMVWIGVLGWCLMANYSGAYAMGFASLIGLFVIVNLEERDLKKRFGEQYAEYQKTVPQLVPTIPGFTRFVSENFRK